jgi:hypothetical protein
MANVPTTSNPDALGVESPDVPDSRAAEGVPEGKQRHRLGPRELWRGFKRLTQLGWPKKFPIVQFPNAPLIIAFLAGQVAAQAHGAPHAYASATSYLAMIIWAYEELAHGVNWFRHLLGLGYAISTVVHIALALQR